MRQGGEDEAPERDTFGRRAAGFAFCHRQSARQPAGRRPPAGCNGVRALHVDGRKPENGCRFAAAGHDTALCFRKTAVRLGRTRRPCGSDDSLSCPLRFGRAGQDTVGNQADKTFFRYGKTSGERGDAAFSGKRGRAVFRFEGYCRGRPQRSDSRP